MANKTADEIRGQIAEIEARDERADALDRAQEHSEGRRAARWERRSVRRRTRAGMQVPPLISGVIYAGAFGTAVEGQMSTAEHLFGWHWYQGAGLAAFVELIGFRMAWASRQQRLEGERGTVPQVATWTVAGFAAAVNAYAHIAIPLEGALLGAASLAGIFTWEICSGLPLRKALREKQLLRNAPVRIGWHFALRFPVKAFDAWSARVENPSITTLPELLEAGAARRSARRPVRWGKRTVWGWWRSDRPDQTATAAPADRGPDRADQTEIADQRTSGLVAVRSGSGPQTTDQTADHGPDQRTDRPDRTGGPSDRASEISPDGAGREGADQPDDTDQTGPDLADIDQPVRDALPLVRPFAEELWADGQPINRRNLRAAISAAPAERRPRVENTVLGKVSQILRAEMPLSPESVKAAG